MINIDKVYEKLLILQLKTLPSLNYFFKFQFKFTKLYILLSTILILITMMTAILWFRQQINF